jgi:formylglycine-generating enzyme required for sulfatase activity
MISIAEGEFWMGSNTGAPGEQPAHRVFVAAFAISAMTVTRAEYSEFLQATGHVAPAGWEEAAFADPRQPVVGVSWSDATAYCRWLSSTRGTNYRLPSEAEWEKACRGGLAGTVYSWGNTPPEHIDYYRSEWTGPRVSGQRPPNPFGLFNMGDNVHEWCSDWYAADYYAVSPLNNPQGPDNGTRRVSRGGSWRHLVKASRNAHRSSLPPEYRYTDYGFRLVTTL